MNRERKFYRNVPMQIIEDGSGPTFIWGHSLMGSSAVDTAAGLFDWATVAQHSHLIRYDARGHGRSGGSGNPEEYRWSSLADDMLTIADDYGDDKPAILGGVSMGCATALTAAWQNQTKVAGLVLVLPPCAWRTRPKQARFYRRMATVNGVLGSIPYRLLNMLPAGEPETAKAAMASATARGLASANIKFMNGALRGAALSDLPPMADLKKLHIPTAIFAWTDDWAHPESTAELLDTLLPDVRIYDLADAADVGRWTPQLLSFIEEISGSLKAA